MENNTVSLVEQLEKRLAALERKIYGDKKDESVKVVDSMMNLQNKLQSVVTGREKITSIFAKLDDLNKLLDPGFAENLALPTGAKMELVLASEDKIRDTVASLQTIKELEQYVDSEHIKAAPALLPKLKQINKAQLEMLDNVSEFDEETKKLAIQYNNVVSTLNQQFVLWDSVLTDMERQKEQSEGDVADAPSKSRLHWFEKEF